MRVCIKGWFKHQWHKLAFQNPISNYFRFLKMKVLLESVGYEREVSTYLKKVYGNVFLDLGSHVGYYSLLLRNNFRIIYAFEPLLENFSMLCFYIKKFNAKNVFPIMKAVTNENGKESLMLIDYGSVEPHIRFDPFTRKQLTIVSEGQKYIGKFPKFPSSIRQIETVSLSSCFPSLEIECIKMDVEGNEFNILEGAKPIMSNINGWIIELHYLKRKQEMEELLQSYGYSTGWLDKRHIYARMRV